MNVYGVLVYSVHFNDLGLNFVLDAAKLKKGKTNQIVHREWVNNSPNLGTIFGKTSV